MLPALALRLRVRVLLALLAAAAVCLLATPAVRKFACKIGAMDMPGESRRVHDHPIPRLGGLALFAGFLAGVLPFTGIDEPVQGILLGSVIIVVTGAVDDLVSLRPWVKLVLQIIAAIVAIRHGVVIRILTNPGDASAEAIALGALSVPVTLLWIVGMTNALNLIDGLDGLAAGVCGIGCASMLAVSLFLPAGDGDLRARCRARRRVSRVSPVQHQSRQDLYGRLRLAAFGLCSLHGVGARPF